MYDKITNLRNSIIQHGKMNDRIYLMDFDITDSDTIIKDLNHLALKYSYSKIIVKIPIDIENVFIADCYTREAYIPKYYKGRADCTFLSKYYRPSRAVNIDNNKIQDVINVVFSKERDATISKLESYMTIRKLTLNDIKNIVYVYRTVFSTYPFPIHDEDYINKTMQENVVYYGIFDKNKLFAISSTELCPINLNAEMTDFAILPEYRGNNYSLNLLTKMEKILQAQGYKTLYTIARAISYGMNSTFHKLDYIYSGTLINNTNIFGKIESMNVWYKNL